MVVIHGRMVARNALLNLAGQGLPLVVAVFAMPVVIGGLGPERFALLSFAWVALGYFSIFDLGLGRAATKLVSEAIGQGQDRRVPRIVWTAVVGQTGLGILGCLVLVAGTPLLVDHVLRAPPTLVIEARTTFYVLALSIPCVLVASSFRGLLEALQRFDLVSIVRATFLIATFLVPVLGVLLEWSLPGIVVFLVVAQALAATAYLCLCLRAVPQLRAGIVIDRSELRLLTWFGGWVTVSSIVSPLLVYMERFMIGMLLSISAVTYYAAPHEIAARLLIVPASLVGTLFPALTTLRSQGDSHRSDAITARSIKYLLLLLTPIVTVSAVYARDILGVWLGQDFASKSTGVLQLVSFAVLVNSLAFVPFTLLQAQGRPDLTAKFHLVELPIQILLVLVCVRLGGITGAAVAWSARVTLDGLLLFWSAFRLRAMSFSLMLTCRVPQTAAVLAGAACIVAIGAWAVTAPLVRVVFTATVFAVFVGVAWRYLLDEAERAQIHRLLRVVSTPS